MFSRPRSLEHDRVAGLDRHQFNRQAHQRVFVIPPILKTLHRVFVLAQRAEHHKQDKDAYQNIGICRNEINHVLYHNCHSAEELREWESAFGTLSPRLAKSPHALQGREARIAYQNGNIICNMLIANIPISN